MIIIQKMPLIRFGLDSLPYNMIIALSLLLYLYDKIILAQISFHIDAKPNRPISSSLTSVEWRNHADLIQDVRVQAIHDPNHRLPNMGIKVLHIRKPYHLVEPDDTSDSRRASSSRYLRPWLLGTPWNILPPSVAYRRPHTSRGHLHGTRRHVFQKDLRNV